MFQVIFGKFGAVVRYFNDNVLTGCGNGCGDYWCFRSNRRLTSILDEVKEDKTKLQLISMNLHGTFRCMKTRYHVMLPRLPEKDSLQSSCGVQPLTFACMPFSVAAYPVNNAADFVHLGFNLLQTSPHQIGRAAA